MASTVTQVEEAVSRTGNDPLINDVVIKIATPNGSGSTSSNVILLRSIFNMGIPVGGKNLFPSNIEGLPTWFTIRVNDGGWTAHRTNTDFLVATNPQTVDEDVAELESGGILVIDDTLASRVGRADIEVYSVPFGALVKETGADTRLRRKIVNMVYVGVVARLLHIEMDEVAAAIDHQFGSKLKAAELNCRVAVAGHEWAEKNIGEEHRFRLQRSEKTAGKILIEGNDATAIGMMFGGATVAAWYPITPSTGVCEALAQYMEKYRHDPETGKATYAIIQAEDEIASIGMTLGAAWAGARSFTATSGPGLSLMAEMAGLSYFAEIPAVIVDVQRMGPSTGLPTRNSQGDIMSAYHLSHGDCTHVLLLPGNVCECYEFAMAALRLADRLQTLVLLMGELDMGMNFSISDPFNPPTEPISRGKVLSAEDVERLGGFERYADVDRDGVGYRTLPGTPHEKASFFTRGTGHTPRGTYSEDADEWQENLDRLSRKFDTARGLVPKPVIEEEEGGSVGIIAYGTSDSAVQEARYHLAKRHGIATNYLRIRALPSTAEVEEFINRNQVVYVVDQNRDGQMATILRGEIYYLAPKIRSVRHYNGMPLDAETVLGQIVDQESGKEVSR
jgi:2-oxoglutarate ferredoxin oxidoreductase subunit alpha